MSISGIGVSNAIGYGNYYTRANQTTQGHRLSENRYRFQGRKVRSNAEVDFARRYSNIM